MRCASGNIGASLFVVAGLCFLLPFLTLSCSGQRLSSVTGVQLAAGVVVGSGRSPGDARVAFALGMCVLGILLRFMGVGSVRRISSALAATAGILALLSFKMSVDADTLKQGHGMIRVQYEAGYYLILISFVGAAAAWFWHPRAGLPPPEGGALEDGRRSTELDQAESVGPEDEPAVESAMI